MNNFTPKRIIIPEGGIKVTGEGSFPMTPKQRKEAERKNERRTTL